jgi:hypothetical protein
MIHHSGGINGFTSLVTFLPQANLGVVVLNNLGSPVPQILTYNAIDRLLGLEEVPWSDHFMKDHLEWKAGQERGKEKDVAEQVPRTRPSHPLESYAGDFVHPAYGTLAVRTEGDGLSATINGVVRPLRHYHYDVFELSVEEWDLRLKLSFSTDVQGEIESVAAPFEPAVAPIVFKRAAAREMTERSFLERFVGEYELMGLPMLVALKGQDALRIALPGQPDYDLVPYRGSEFRIKGLTGFRVEFKSDALGVVTEALLTQPGAVLSARRKAMG